MKHNNLFRLVVLAAVLLLAVMVFASCSGTSDTPETTVGETTTPPAAEGTTLAVGDYSIVYAKDSETAKSAAEALAAAATSKLGAAFKAVASDSEIANSDPNALEILIGATDRAQSNGTLAQLKGALGYVIQLNGSKLSINATSAELLDEAVQYFITTYVNEGASGAFSVPADLLYTDTSIGGISLLDENGKLQYEIVYSIDLDTSEGKDEYDRVDYVVLYINKLIFGDTAKKVDGLVKVLGDTDISACPDDKPTNLASMEILIGNTNRPETESFRNTLAINEYGYGIVGNKLVITGWSDLTIGKAVDLFIANMKDYVKEEGGVKTMLLYESDCVVSTHKVWNMDVPHYNAGKQDYVIELDHDSYEVIYTDTTLAEYQAYCADLTATKGYQAYQTNQIGDNHYGTYTNGTTMIHVYYVAYMNAVRFVTESMKTVVLPQKTDSVGEKITEMTFTMFDLDDKAENFGNCFIITLEDGSFIFHDGGGDKSTYSNGDRDELYALFQRLNKREDGKIVIAAWIISHQHWDHIKNGIDFMKHYYRDIQLERIIYNVAVESVYYNTRNPNNYVHNFTSIQMQTGCELVRMHTGQTIRIRNLTLEVLYTTEDLYPEHPYTFNNTTFVHRFDVGEGANRQRVQILGDIEDVASNIMCSMYSAETLKCDVLQVAHHGWGATTELYARFSPSVVLWPNTQATVNSHLANGSTGYYQTINKSLCNQKNVLLIVVADKGHKMVSLPVVGLTNDRNVNQANLVVVMPREDGL